MNYKVCKECLEHKPIIKDNLCETCYYSSHVCCNCKKLLHEERNPKKPKPMKNIYAIKLSPIINICSYCLLDLIDVNEIFKDGIMQERKEQQIKTVNSDNRLLILYSLILLIITIVYTILTINSWNPIFIMPSFIILLLTNLSKYIFKKEDKSAITFTIYVIGLIASLVYGFFNLYLFVVFFYITILLIKYTVKQIKNKQEKINNITKQILLTSNFNKFEAADITNIIEIINFGKKLERYTESDLNKLNETDIAYIASENNVSPLLVKSYITYYLRITKEYSKVLEKVLKKINYDKEYKEYYKAIIKYNEIMNNNKNKMPADEYFKHALFVPSNYKLLTYGAIKLDIKTFIDKAIILNKEKTISGLVRVNLYQDNIKVAEGYMYGTFENEIKKEVTCVPIKNIDNITNIKMETTLLKSWID